MVPTILVVALLSYEDGRISFISAIISTRTQYLLDDPRYSDRSLFFVRHLVRLSNSFTVIQPCIYLINTTGIDNF